MLDIDSFCVHNFLYNVGSHLILVFSYFLTMLADICILFFILDTTTILWQFFLIDSQLQPEQTKQTRVKQPTSTQHDKTVTKFLQLREDMWHKCSHSCLTRGGSATGFISLYSLDIQIKCWDLSSWLNKWLPTPIFWEIMLCCLCILQIYLSPLLTVYVLFWPTQLISKNFKSRQFIQVLLNSFPLPQLPVCTMWITAPSLSTFVWLPILVEELRIVKAGATFCTLCST